MSHDLKGIKNPKLGFRSEARLASWSHGVGMLWAGWLAFWLAGLAGAGAATPEGDALEEAREILWEMMEEQEPAEEGLALAEEEVSEASPRPRPMSPRHAAQVEARSRRDRRAGEGGALILESKEGVDARHRTLPPRQVVMQQFRRRGPEFDPRQPASDGSVEEGLPGLLDPALLDPSRDPFVIGPGDVLDIEIPGVEGTKSST
jgi:hypothetical protein